MDKIPIIYQFIDESAIGVIVDIFFFTVFYSIFIYLLDGILNYYMLKFKNKGYIEKIKIKKINKYFANYLIEYITCFAGMFSFFITLFYCYFYFNYNMVFDHISIFILSFLFIFGITFSWAFLTIIVKHHGNLFTFVSKKKNEIPETVFVKMIRKLNNLNILVIMLESILIILIFIVSNYLLEFFSMFFRFNHSNLLEVLSPIYYISNCKLNNAFWIYSSSNLNTILQYSSEIMSDLIFVSFYLMIYVYANAIFTIFSSYTYIEITCFVYENILDIKHKNLLNINYLQKLKKNSLVINLSTLIFNVYIFVVSFIFHIIYLRQLNYFVNFEYFNLMVLTFYILIYTLLIL
ncbi:MAG: hypothetical protein ACTSRP_24585, partial [Candidatus Helarchaeota archaeon]